MVVQAYGIICLFSEFPGLDILEGMEIGAASPKQARQWNSEEERLNSTIAKRKQQLVDNIDQMDTEHKEQIENINKYYKKQLDELDQGYKVELSKKSEMQAKELDRLHDSHVKRLEEEKKAQDKEFEQVHERELNRVNDYRKKQDAVIEKLHAKYQAASDEMEKNNR